MRESRAHDINEESSFAYKAFGDTTLFNSGSLSVLCCRRAKCTFNNRVHRMSVEDLYHAVVSDHFARNRL